MSVSFERGQQDKPKGHALLYFRSSSDIEEVWGTYLVMLPITVDVSKYVPPFLMNQIGEMGPKDLSAFAFPPAPEKLESYQYLENLADARDDDLLYAGDVNPTDVQSMMMAVSDAVQQYAELYASFVESEQPQDSHGLPDGFGVNEVMYSLMSDSDKLNELTKLVGRLRFAVEGEEQSLAQEAEVDINLLANHLPEDHQTTKLIDAVKTGGNQGEQLAALYLQRCFHIVHQEYEKVGDVEKQIQSIESEPDQD